MHRNIVLISITLFLLAQVGLSQERIGLLKVVSGTVKIDGKPVARASIVSEGQQLDLSPDAKVRINLLHSSKQVVINDGRTHTLKKRQLLSMGKVVDRGQVSVREDLGDQNEAASLKVRGNFLELRPTLPPKFVKGRGWYFYMNSEKKPLLEKGRSIKVKLSELSESGPKDIMNDEYRGLFKQFALKRGNLRPGRTYRLRMESSNQSNTDISACDIDFRILTEAEDEYVTEAERKWANGNVADLWLLAETYSALAQPKPLLDTLKKIRTASDEEDVPLDRMIQELHNRYYMNLDGFKTGE